MKEKNYSKKVTINLPTTLVEKCQEILRLNGISLSGYFRLKLNELIEKWEFKAEALKKEFEG